MNQNINASIEVFYTHPKYKYKWPVVKELISMMSTDGRKNLLKQLMRDAVTIDGSARLKSGQQGTLLYDMTEVLGQYNSAFREQTSAITTL